jgi:hypothetical protein
MNNTASIQPIEHPSVIALRNMFLECPVDAKMVDEYLAEHQELNCICSVSYLTKFLVGAVEQAYKERRGEPEKLLSAAEHFIMKAFVYRWIESAEAERFLYYFDDLQKTLKNYIWNRDSLTYEEHNRILTEEHLAKIALNCLTEPDRKYRRNKHE